MPKWTEADLDSQARIRAWIRCESHRLKLGVNALARQFGVSSGTMSKYLQGQGFGPGIAVKARQVLDIEYKRLLEIDPPAEFFEAHSEFKSEIAGRPPTKPRREPHYPPTVSAGGHGRKRGAGGR